MCHSNVLALSRLVLVSHPLGAPSGVWVWPMHVNNSLFDSCMSHSAIGLACATVPNPPSHRPASP